MCLQSLKALQWESPVRQKFCSYTGKRQCVSDYIFGLKAGLLLLPKNCENCTKDFGFTQGQPSSLHLHCTAELWGLFQALQVYGEKNWWRRVRVQSFMERSLWHYHALCVHEHEQGETAIHDIPAYGDNWIGQILSFKLGGLFVRKQCLQKENKPNQLRQKWEKSPISPGNQVFLIISIK